ncbi:hypothetical protein JCM33374_g558 [Metschnikowia sp. JCM 33374]|nr:hypothetical protein JCM33374_g558 [Metschnikowia sp. JCM 33374]
MIFSVTLITALASVVNAIPFKRYDNETISASQDLTLTIDKYITSTWSSPVVVAPSTSVSTSVFNPITSVVTQYVTETIHGVITTSPISTYTTISSTPSPAAGIVSASDMTTSSESTTTSTITDYVTITKKIKSSTTENKNSQFISASQTADACVCVPSTVTVTVTGAASTTTNNFASITSTMVTSYPVIGEFSLSGSTTKITSFVEVTLTETSYIPIATATPAFSSFNNGTATSSMKMRRTFFYDF